MLFNRNIEPCCVYCSFGTDIGNEEVMCIKRGVMNAYGSCGSFRYEPTKRVPEVASHVTTKEFTDDDFTL